MTAVEEITVAVNQPLGLPGGTDPDLYSASGSATRSEFGGISRVRRGGCLADDGWPRVKDELVAAISGTAEAQ